MANNYEQIMALVNAGNKMGLSNTITRDNGIPLDLSSVYSSYNDAVVYAATKAIAYHGQPIAVITETDAVLYVITPVSQGKETINEVEYDVYLKQVGAKTLGDEKSITLSEDGVLSVAGFNTAAGATLPQKQADGTIKWVAIDAIVEGDGNTKTVIASSDSQLTVTPSHDEESDTYTYTLGLNVDFSNYLTKSQVETAIADALQAAKDYADANDADTKYDDTALAGRVNTIEEVVGDVEGGLVKGVADNKTAIEAEAERATKAEAKTLADAKEYIDAEIDGITVVIEQKDGVEHIVVKDKDGVEIASANASKFVQDSFLDDVAYDAESGKITFTWSMGDGSTKTDEVAVADFVQIYTAGNGLSLSGNEFSVDTNVIATVEALNSVRDIAEAAQTAQEVSDAIDAKIATENLAQYAKTSDVETTLADYAKTADVNNTLVDYAKSADVADVYATKTELADGLAGKVDGGTITHTVDGVAEGVTVDGTTLNIVVDSYTKAETRDYVADVIADMTGGESAADVKLALENHIKTYNSKVAELIAKDAAHDTAIATAQTTGENAQNAADRAQTTAEAAAEAVVALNNGQVTINKNDIAAIITRLGTVETSASTSATNIAAIDGRLTVVEGTVNSHITKIGAIEGNLIALGNEDARLASLIANKVDASDVYTKTEADEAIAAAIGAIPEVDLGAYAKIADVDEALAIKANAADVYTKAAADATFMNQDEVDLRINALIAAADPEGGKTITDIQNLVKYVDENASEIAKLIADTNANTAKLAGIDSTVAEYVNATVAAVTLKASKEVTIDDNNILGIGEISTDKLVQGVNTLVIDGGTAC